MIFGLYKKKEYTYIEEGQGVPLVLLHGLMGGLSNFNYMVEHFSKRGYKVYSLELPLYNLPIIKTNIKGLTRYVISFIKEIVKSPCILVGNSLGGHLALMATLKFPNLIDAIVLIASSGLYERSFGESYPKLSDYEYIKRKTEEVFYDPKVATKEIVDDIFNLFADRPRTLKTIYISRSALKHNMAKDLPKIKHPCCLIWGKQDNVTPLSVGEEFNELIPNSELFWIDKCGHSPMMEQPHEFNEILEKWLKKIGK